MPETYRDYDTREVGVLTRSYAPHTAGTKERAQEGDIVVVRRPHHAIGTAEMSDYLWLHIEGMDVPDMEAFVAPLEEGSGRRDKRRYCMPFHRLLVVAPWLDLARVRDTADAYQPFLCVDMDVEWFQHHRDGPVQVPGLRMPGACRRPLRVEGLVFDKAVGRYL